MTQVYASRKSTNSKFWFQLVLVLAAIIVIPAHYAAQKTQTTKNKSDSNLQTSARVNPLTFAMEFSFPLGGYPGRSGNSNPIVLNYSSKVWTMERFSFLSRSHDASTNIEEGPDRNVDAIVFNVSNITANFSSKRYSGWNSSLQPISILREQDFYDQNGELFSFLFIPYISSISTECQIIEVGSLMRTSACASGWGRPAVVQCTGPTCQTGPQNITGNSCYITGIECFEAPTGGGGGGGGGGQNPPLPQYPTPTPTPQVRHEVQRVRIQMPDGSTSEFRKADKAYNCDDFSLECNGDITPGTYLAVDGSGMRLNRNEDQGNSQTRDVLYLPSGDRYIFYPNVGWESTLYLDIPVEKHIDRNGNISTYNYASKTWMDSVGREIQNPLRSVVDYQSTVGEQSYTLKGLDGEDRQYILDWAQLGDVFDDRESELHYVGFDSCASEFESPVNGSNVLFTKRTPYDITIGTQNGNDFKYVNKQRVCSFGVSEFNPVVLRNITTPNGETYRFKYNEYGEISKIIYPSGAYERFEYSEVPLQGAVADFVYTQSNRGVRAKFVSIDGIAEEAPTLYGPTANPLSAFAITAPDGMRSEQNITASYDSRFGFDDPSSGRPYETRNYDSDGNLVGRSFTEWLLEDPRGPNGNPKATRDPRVKRSVSIIFEPESSIALATMTVNEFDETGSSDPEHFSHLNIKRQIGYHYKAINVTTAETADLATISGLFGPADIASATETDYVYDSAYKARGITSLPIRSRVLDPVTLDPQNPLAKSETIYDNALPAANGNYPYSIQTYGTGNSMDCSSDPQNPKVCWQNPNGTSGNIDMAFRGLPTTTRVWNSDTNTWIETHTQYDQFGNAVKAKDPIGNEATTEFSATYKYAYPTKVIAPAPDPTNTTGTNQTSTAETTYDFTTGLPLTVKDDFGQITRTEYDAQLRPIRVFADNFTAPESQTIYGVPNTSGQLPPDQRFVKVRKQIDANNWDEAVTWFDGLGRTIQTTAKDSQGDVKVDTHYDQFGRVERVTNPYRQGDTVLWSKTRYDAAGRAVESYAPATFAEILTASTTNNANLTSLGVTSFDISNVNNASGNFIGTVVTTTDASGRKGRSITNALGQLLRVDEPTGISGSAEADLGPLDQPIQPTSYKYDVKGNMVEVTQGVQKRWFKYDSLGRLIRVRQPEQEVNSSLYLADAFNTSGGWTAGFAYDLMGNVVRATDANGVNIINDYDRANRVIRRCYTKPEISTSAVSCVGVAGPDISSTTPAVFFYYDGKGLAQQQSPNFAKGKLTKVTSTVSETQYQLFDNLGRLTQSAQITDGQTYTSSYQYNFSGALVQETYPSGRIVKNEFESDGDLLNVTSKKSGGNVFTPYVSNFSYTASGGISQMRLGNGRWEIAKFNNRVQVTELGLGNSATDASVWKTAYEYGELDSNGNVVTAKNTGNIAKQTLTVPGTSFTQSYKYDSLYRLKEAVEKTGTETNWSQVFNYDRYGNRTFLNQFIGSLNLNTTPAVNANTNRFTSTDFGYDKNGNVIADIDQISNLPRQFIFNGDNKQSEVKRDGVTIGRYFYDGEGKRIKKVTDTETTVFVYSSGKLIAEYSTQISQTPSVAYTTTDHLGTPRIITNELGQVKARRDFMPFGEELYVNVGGRSTNLNYGTSEDEIRQKFTGYERDNESSLDFAQARMYNFQHGRFTAVDPLLESGTPNNPQSWNRYTYTFNNPLNYVDPTGLIAMDDYYINRDGSWNVIETDCKCDSYYLETQKGSGEYREVATLQQNAAGLVEFPGEMDFFTRYGQVDKGGGDHGAGDHFVRPDVAAGLFGLSAVLKDDHGITMSYGDMSSSNGKDPWQPGSKHHAGHGHGSRSGVDVDYRYINNNGESFQSPTARSDSQFSVSKNQTVYDTAKTFGFTENYQGNSPGRNTGITGPKPVGGHNDHGHLGFSGNGRSQTSSQAVVVTQGNVRKLIFK